MERPVTPTLDRIQQMQPQASAVGEFLDYLLDETNYVICVVPHHPDSWRNDRTYGSSPECYGVSGCPDSDQPWHGARDSAFHTFRAAPFVREQVIADFLGIDLQRRDREQAALLEYLTNKS